MKRLSARLNWMLQYHEVYAFIGLWLWLAIFTVINEKSGGWLPYFQSLGILGITQIPAIAFSVFRQRWKSGCSRRKYLVSWAICFLVILPFVTFGSALLATDNDSAMLLATGGSCAFALELILSANRYYQRKVQHYKWIKRIGLENSILISLILIALTLSAMAVSSLNNPAYHTKNQLLIGFEFSVVKIFQHFFTFLSFFVQFLIIYLSGYLFFFVNSRFLVAKILKQKGMIAYSLSLLATIALAYPFVAQLLISLPINRIFGGEIFPNNPFALENAFGALGITLVSLPIVLSLQWMKQNTQIMSLEQERSRTELDLLKQQLNPHFFFNTLNNLYGLSIQQSDKTSESILQLAELMRYTIYKGQAENVTLEQELKYLNDYIQLQQIRLKHPLQLIYQTEISNQQQPIVPLMLIVLVENAFKHGIEPAEETACLNLFVKCDEETFYFRCQNSFEEQDEVEYGGIGLSNLKKRLMLLYPNRHQLKIDNEKSIFSVELTIGLK